MARFKHDRTAVYMTMAYLVAMQSKDERTWIGAVIVGPDNEVRSTGYNGWAEANRLVILYPQSSRSGKADAGARTCTSATSTAQSRSRQPR